MGFYAGKARTKSFLFFPLFLQVFRDNRMNWVGKMDKWMRSGSFICGKRTSKIPIQKNKNSQKQKIPISNLILIIWAAEGSGEFPLDSKFRFLAPPKPRAFQPFFFQAPAWRWRVRGVGTPRQRFILLSLGCPALHRPFCFSLRGDF